MEKITSKAFEVFYKTYRGQTLATKEVKKLVPWTTFRRYLKKGWVQKVGPGLYYIGKKPKKTPCTKELLKSAWSLKLSRYVDEDGYIWAGALLVICKSDPIEFAKLWKGGKKIRVKKNRIHFRDFIEAYAQFKEEFDLLKEECQKWLK